MYFNLAEFGHGNISGTIFISIHCWYVEQNSVCSNFAAGIQ